MTESIRRAPGAAGTTTVGAPPKANAPPAPGRASAASSATVRAPGDEFGSVPPQGRTLHRGATGADVKGLQALLVQAGLMTDAEVAHEHGKFGRGTEQALQRFQKDKGLPVTGTANDAVRAALAEAIRQKTTTTTTTDTDTGTHLGTDLNDPLGEPVAMQGQQGVLAHSTGPLFGAYGPQPSDINQGQAGDCYLLSALGAIAQTHPEAIKDLIKQQPDGTYTVTLKSADPSGKGQPVTIKIDDRLWVSSSQGYQGALYDHADQASYKPVGAGGGYPQSSTWSSLVEKAIAKTSPTGFDGIGHGGWPRDMLARILGRPSEALRSSQTTPEDMWKKLTAATANGDPTCASTWTDGASADKYTNTGIVHGHAYAVLGTSEKDGEKYVTLRNPWGNTEPAGDGKDDGVFQLKLADFMKYYEYIDTSPGPKTTPAPGT